MAPKSSIQVPAQTAQAVDYITYKNKITQSVMNRIAELQKGGICMPKGYNAQNQLMLAFLKLSGMEDPKSHQPILSLVSAQSVANALLSMCIKGLSLEKSQCAFIRYGGELTMQPQYQGIVAMAKRYGADDPQAQVIYEGDDFEYTINPRTGKKEILKHDQKLGNIDNSKIIGAWCIVPYADHPEKEPKVEVMTIAEIRQAWMQGATKGESGAHRNFTQEMAKKTVIGRACKLFIETSSDAGVYDDVADDAEFQAQPAQPAIGAGETDLSNIPALQTESIGAEVDAPPAAQEPEIKTQTASAESEVTLHSPAADPQRPEPEFNDNMFDPNYRG